MKDGPSILGPKKNGTAVIIEDGIAKMPDRSCFAGSVATGERLFNTLYKTMSLGVVEASRLLSLQPASTIGMDGDVGSIEVGKKADLLIINEEGKIEKIYKEGVEIKDNSGFIAQAERQCVNSRIQGSAASMTKQAMLDIYNDSKLRNLGFKLLISVHDELIGECPLENRDEVANRLSEVMRNAAATKCSVPFKSDADISTCWYINEYVALVEDEFSEKLQKGMSEEEAFESECEERTESTRGQLYEILREHLKTYKPQNVEYIKSIY